MLITCTCCDDLTKGAQDKDFSYSFSILSPSGPKISLTHYRFSLSGPLLCIYLYTLTITHSHTLLITRTCYDESKRTKDQDISYSLFNSLSLCCEYRSLTMYLYTHTITHSHTMLITCTCCYDLTKGTQDKDFSYSFSILPLHYDDTDEKLSNV